MTRRLLIAALSIASLLSFNSGNAAGAHIVDRSGDANGLNGQAFPGLASLDSSSQALGAQIDHLDITTVTWSTEFEYIRQGTRLVKTPKYIVAQMRLSGSPTADQTPRKYEIYFKLGECQALHSVTWDVSPQNPSGVPDSVDLPAATLPVVGTAGGPVYVWTRGARLDRGSCFNDAAVVNLPLSKVAGNSLVWRIPIKEMAKAGTQLWEMRAASRMRVRSAYPYPVGDTASSKNTFILGS